MIAAPIVTLVGKPAAASGSLGYVLAQATGGENPISALAEWGVAGAIAAVSIWWLRRGDTQLAASNATAQAERDRLQAKLDASLEREREAIVAAASAQAKAEAATHRAEDLAERLRAKDNHADQLRTKLAESKSPVEVQVNPNQGVTE